MRHIPHSCAVGQNCYLYLPPWPGGREKDLRFKLNVSVFHAGVEAGDRVAGIFHAQAVAQAEALFFQRAGDP